MIRDGVVICDNCGSPGHTPRSHEVEANPGREKRSCQVKAKLTAGEKRRALKAMRRAGHVDMHWYKCLFCGFFHLGHEQAAP